MSNLGRGFDPGFLGDGLVTPLPSLGRAANAAAWRGGEPLDYEHFSIVMNAERRLATFTAHNIDGAHLVMSKRGNWWDFDPRLPRERQIGGEFYRGTRWDRGHMVRRRDVVWGPVEEARRANRHTFFFTNAAPQHHNFNTDEWLLLEDWILDTADQERHRLNVFTGPVFRSDDLTDRDVLVPAGFWKVVVRRDPRDAGALSVVAAMMKQNEMWQDDRGAELLQLEVHQVSVELIEELTGLDMGPLRASDELSDWVPRRTRDLEGVERVVWPVIRRAEDLVLRSALDGGSRARPLGLSDAPTGRRARGLEPDAFVAGPGGPGAELERVHRADREFLTNPTPGVEPIERHRPPPTRRARALAPDGPGVSSEELEQRVVALVEAGVSGSNDDLVRDLLLTALGCARDGAGRHDLRLLAAALRELRLAFATFAPHAHRRKVTLFGSARTPLDHPGYEQARELAARMVAHGYQILTGGGPGIMRAGNQGAGVEHGFALNIQLPFEQKPNEFVAADKLLHFRYFFTRKLCLIKEADAVVVCHGGFGTQDELFEVLTLVQTGRSSPIPIVLLEPPGADHWQGWQAWVSELRDSGLIGPEDLRLFRLVPSAEAAEAEILRFYRRFHSSHQAGDELVIRMESELPPERLEELQREFADLLRPGGGRIRAEAAASTEGEPAELAHLPRLVLPFDRRSHGRLREMIDRINS